MKILLRVFIGFGTIILLGTAGASDYSNLPLGQSLVQIMISVGFIAAGFFGLKWISVRQRVLKKEEHNQKSKFLKVA